MKCLSQGNDPVHARIQEFLSGGGGGPGQSDKKALTTFFFFFFFFFFQSSAYFTEVKWLISKKTIIFQGSRGGPTFSRGGSNFFQGGGWSNCLFPIETHITCDFPGGPDPLSPLWIRTCSSSPEARIGDPSCPQVLTSDGTWQEPNHVTILFDTRMQKGADKPAYTCMCKLFSALLLSV